MSGVKDEGTVFFYVYMNLMSNFLSCACPFFEDVD